nr:hypothetical protein CFP56_79397 [Quercus suber]
MAKTSLKPTAADRKRKMKDLAVFDFDIVGGFASIGGSGFDFFKLFGFGQGEKCKAWIWRHGFFGSIRGKRILEQ